MAGKNTYPRMREIIQALGLQNIKPSAGDHHTHFHIDFRTPDRVGIGGARPLHTSEANPSIESATVGEDTMFLVEAMLANAMAQAEPAPTVQVAAANASPTQTNYVAGLCFATETHAGGSEWGQNRIIGVEEVAGNYVYSHLKRDTPYPTANSVKVERNPKYGTLDIGYAQSTSKPLGEPKYWRYTPKPGYNHVVDHATFLVDVQGIPVRVVAVFKVVSPLPDSAPRPCKIYEWVISSADGTSATDLPAWQTQAQLSTLLASATQSLTGFADLAGSSVGQTTGEGLNANITLDPTAAGHGWYIDPTPLDNTDDYLPTSNPNIWRAKAGSAADAKRAPSVTLAL